MHCEQLVIPLRKLALYFYDIQLLHLRCSKFELKKVCFKGVIIVFVDTGRVRLLDFGAAIQNLKYIIIIEHIQRGMVPLIYFFLL